MIRIADFIRFDKLSDSGRNRPPRVVVETDDGEEHEAVMKPASWRELTVSGVTKEYIAAAIGGLVGVPVCEPFLVQNAPELIANIQDEKIRDELANCTWPAFGSKHAGKQWQNWTTGDLVTAGNKTDALAILAFDAFIDNADRGGATPNLLVKGDALRAIDHEMAFGFTELFIKPAPPWDEQGLDWLMTVEKRNVLLSPLEKAGNLNFQPIRASWSGLANAELDAILHTLPDGWGGAEALAQAAIQRIKDVRDNIDACIVELERVLP